jgi:photosystem II stability/assembly factor-like uncharacterized protein
MTKLNFRRIGAALLGATALTLIAPAYALFGEKPVGPISVPKAEDKAAESKLAKDFLLLNFAKAGQRLIVVGEYGHILLSDDDGKSWRQAQNVPTKSTLTSVVFVDDKRGWAAGHDTIVLHTQDGGETWTRQFGGGNNDDALLTIVFMTPEHGLAMGAFNFTIETLDSGKTWTKRKLAADDAKPAAPAAAPAPAAPAAGETAQPTADDLQAKADAEAEAKAKAAGVDGAYAVAEGDDAHINHAFTGPNGLVLVAAEAGKIYRSTDGGKTFARIQTEYPGSFWGGAVLTDGSILVVGMRGNIWRSTDQGVTWTKSDTGKADQSIASAIQLPDGSVVAVGLSGGLLVSKDGGKTFGVKYRDDRKGLNSVISSSDGKIFVAGEAGLTEVAAEIAAVPAAVPSAKAPSAPAASTSAPAAAPR